MNKKFKHRHGGVGFPLQTEEITEALKNRLWNCFTEHIYKKWNRASSQMRFDSSALSDVQSDSRIERTNQEAASQQQLLETLINEVVDAIGLSRDDLPEHFDMNKSVNVHRKISTLYKSYSWVDVYNFIEETLRYSPEIWKDPYKICLNKVLEEENSGYRVVDWLITPIVDRVEIDEIEEVFANSSDAVITHMEAALKRLSAKPKSLDNYRGAAQEAINSVESAVRASTGESTLGKALKKMKRGFPSNPAFLESMEKLYGYTNSSDTGIRHSLLGDFESLEFAEAKYFVVSCAAFINYIRAMEA